MSKFDKLSAENEWKRSPKIRAEFDDDLEAFLAWKKAESEGRARVFGGSKKQ